MATTITATPQPATASVLVEVTTDPPTVVLDKDGADIVFAHLYGATATDDGDDVVLSSVTVGSFTSARVNLSGLTIGARYLVELTHAGDEPKNATGGAMLSVEPPPTHQDIPEAPGVTALEFTAVTTNPQVIVYLRDATLRVHHLRVIRLPAGYTFTLTRQDANGLRAVRLFDGQSPAGGGLVVTDYEAALTGPITYAVTTTGVVTATTALDLAETWLMVPVVPQHSTRVDLVTGYTEESTARTTVHEIIGAEYPTLTLRPLGRRQGRLVLWCPDYATAASIVAVYRRGETVMLRQPDFPGLDMYHAATGRLSIEPADEQAPAPWSVTVEFTESQVPTAPLSGALGWDMAADYTRNPTLGESFAEWPTLADRYAGPS